MTTKREVIVALRPIVAEYRSVGAGSVALIRRQLRGTTWLPRLVAVRVLRSRFGMDAEEIATILRLYPAEVPGLWRLLTVLMRENVGIRKEVRRCLRGSAAS